MPDQLVNGVGTLVSLLTGLGLWKGGHAVVNRYSRNNQQEPTVVGGIPVVSPEDCQSQHEFVETKLLQVQKSLDDGGGRMDTMTTTLQEIKEAQIKNSGKVELQLSQLNGKLRKEIDEQIDTKVDKLEEKSEKNMDRHEKRFHPVT